MEGESAMRVEVKGLHSTYKHLASGETRVYSYAWRGGPRLNGKLGTPEFMASYNAALASRPAEALRSDKVLEALVDAYLDSQNFLKLRDRTQADYRKQTRVIVAEFGSLPIAALADKRVAGVFLDWRDKLGKKSTRQADYAWAVLALILAWGKKRGRISVNPCERGGRLYDGARPDKVWRYDEESMFLGVANGVITLAYLLAVWTGQRQGDLLRLTWTAYDGTHIRLRQSKTGRNVMIPCGAPLRKILDVKLAELAPRKAATILTTIAGLTWTQQGFSASWRKTQARAGIKGLTFNDLRGTAVLRLALAGCTVPEIAAITGHSPRDAQTILDVNYFHRDQALAESAMRKLETRFGNKKVATENEQKSHDQTERPEFRD
jgi:integrase